MEKVILFGAGGYSDNIRIMLNCKADVVGYLDDSKTGSYHGLKILGSKVEDISNYDNYSYFVCVGDICDRKRIFEYLNSMNLNIINVVSEHAYVSPDAKIGKGNYIAPGAKILADVEIGDNNYIGTSAIIEHGSRIGNNCRIASGAILNGEAIVGNEVFFGSNAMCIECLNIGVGSTVGGGAVVINDVPDNVTVVGNPARIIKKKEREKIVIIGAGQQGRNCKRLANELLIDVVAFVDEYESDYVEGIKVYRKIEDIANYDKFKYIIGIGDINVRRRYVDEINRLSLDSITLIDPHAVIEKGAKIGKGNYIYKLATVYASATIGDHNIINSGTILATDSVIGNNCNICFGSVICGDCHVGDDSVVGYNAEISSGFNIGKDVVVEANSVIRRNVNDGEYVSGIEKEKDND
ncbi:MAG TPA: hypothetical protein DHV37_06050 [Erysipelotrichaceae bacterium]|nr:hypothetical protein [Erysipelotrichaceae bacterium]